MLPESVTCTSSCDDIFKEKWDNVKENSQARYDFYRLLLVELEPYARHYTVFDA
jgi:hypothetical protein